MTRTAGAIGSPRGPQADLKIDLDVDGLAPIPDCCLDAVIACHVIEHLANPIAALRESSECSDARDDWCLWYRTGT